MPAQTHVVEQNELSTCSRCRRQYPRQDMYWAHDRYGNPWKLSCQRCLPLVEDEIGKWRFDPEDAGESFEPEDY